MKSRELKTYWDETTARNRPFVKTKKCDACGRPFVMDPVTGWKSTPVLLKTEEQSTFRGDDKVFAYHPECDPRKVTSNDRR